ncbi:hypothetical protein MIMGU_mgv1a023710mg, partial [Erythranthe guttata]
MEAKSIQKINEEEEEAQAQVDIWEYVFGFTPMAVVKCAVELKIADILEINGGSMTHTDLSTALNCSPSILHRIMRYLIHRGFFKQNQESSQICYIQTERILRGSRGILTERTEDRRAYFGLGLPSESGSGTVGRELEHGGESVGATVSTVGTVVATVGTTVATVGATDPTATVPTVWVPALDEAEEILESDSHESKILTVCGGGGADFE